MQTTETMPEKPKALTAADLAKALRNFGNQNDRFDWLGQESAIMLEQQDERISVLTDALRWLNEMAGYAGNHLDPEWSRKNGNEFHSALDQANAALAE